MPTLVLIVFLTRSISLRQNISMKKIYKHILGTMVWTYQCRKIKFSNSYFNFPSGSPKNIILKPQVVCPAGNVQESVTLVGGITSGYFRDHGKVKDMQKCRRICCEMPHCHLAFMLSSNCFSVACKSASACKTQPANPSRYSPKISYVRNFDTNQLLGKILFYHGFWNSCAVLVT